MEKSALRLMLVVLCSGLSLSVQAEDGYELWLRYKPVDDAVLLKKYQQNVTCVVIQGSSETYRAIGNELRRGLEGLLGRTIVVTDKVSGPAVIVGTPSDSPLIADLKLTDEIAKLGRDGFAVKNCTVNERACIVIAANRPVGALYGSFRFLRLLQTRRNIANIDINDSPAIELRMLNHWDNPDGGGERGYAGYGLWKWQDLPARIDARYTDYARACASVGINGMVPNNVNAEAKSLSTEYIDKVAALANVLRPYGIKMFLAARWSAPKELDGLATADPLESSVKEWWKAKAEEIYGSIPDFGGFLVKANSEGQPGPYDYGRTHAEGANMLADAVRPHGGIVIWRAFVYGKEKPEPDRIKQAYQEFVPLDGQFKDNVYVQVKNGPLDFQPREPINPLFGAMPKTRINMELQITQEYLGHSVWLVYLAPMWKEVLDSPLYRTELDKRPVSSCRTVPTTVIAGVANTGTDRNWCGHHFAQANWYAFGRLAWDPDCDSKAIAEEWARLTFGNDAQTVGTITDMMMGSWDAAVNSMTPLGLNTLCNAGGGDSGHYSPAPGARLKFHKADKVGVGYDRTSATGSNAVEQYPEPLRTQFDTLGACPDKYLLWFHHVSWDYRVPSGRTLWEELCFRYADGAADAAGLRDKWQSLKGKVDEERFEHISMRLEEQVRQAELWRDTCTTYFRDFSGKPVPEFERQ